MYPSQRTRMGAAWATLWGLLGVACIPVSEMPESEPSSFVIAPISVYSTAKARNLGQRYRENLEGMVARVEAHPMARRLKVSNNIESPGGIGFFTHSASQPPDERYLEMAVKVTDSPDSQDVNSVAKELFERYGVDLLPILAGDSDIRDDQRVAGYALNFSWLDVTTGLKGPERVVIYLIKDKTLAFLDGDIDKAQLFSDAVIFHVAPNRRVKRLDSLSP